MKTNKKLFAVIMSLAMMLSVMQPTMAAVVDYGDELTNMPSKTYAQKFSDVPTSYWAFEYIAEMADRGVLAGYPDGKFYPNKNVTRAEFAKIMASAAGLSIEDFSTLGYYLYTGFDDIAFNSWAAPYINAAKSYLSGYKLENGTRIYKPNDVAVREDIAVALVKLKGYSTTGYDLSIIQTMFTDWQSISSAAQPYVSVAVEQGLISGYDDGTFKGQQGITRAEASTLLWRAYQYGNDNKVYEPELTEKEEFSELIPEPEEEKPEPITTPEPITEPDDDYEEPIEDVDEPVEEEDPEPEYSWKIDTVASNVGFVEEKHYGSEGGVSYTYRLSAGKNSVLYTDGSSLYEANETGSEEIFSCDDLEWQGEPVSKKYTLSQSIQTYDYNYNDDCIYAIIKQNYGGEREYILMNVTNGDFLCLTEECGDIIGFYKDGRIETTDGVILTDGSVADNRLNKDSRNLHMIYNNTLYEYRYKGYEVGVTYYLCKFNLSTNSFDDIDMDTNQYFDTASSAAGSFYKDTSTGIVKLNLKGDSSDLLSYEEIRVDDSIPIPTNNLYGMCVDSDESIYFYDENYKSIRKIERL